MSKVLSISSGFAGGRSTAMSAEEVTPKPGAAGSATGPNPIPVVPLPGAKAMQLPQKNRPKKQRVEMDPAAGLLQYSLSPRPPPATSSP